MKYLWKPLGWLHILRPLNFCVLASLFGIGIAVLYAAWSSGVFLNVLITALVVGIQFVDFLFMTLIILIQKGTNGSFWQDRE